MVSVEMIIQEMWVTRVSPGYKNEIAVWKGVYVLAAHVQARTKTAAAALRTIAGMLN